jgi:hypothetical protein
MQNLSLKRIVCLLVLVGSLAPATSANAAPTAVFDGARTSVSLSTELVSALTSLKVTPAAVFPAFLRQGVAAFPISSGELDLANAKGEVLHSGGLSLSSSDTNVELTQFIIDTANPSGPVLTGLVKVSGNVVGRLPLFTVSLPAVALPIPAVRRLVLSNVGLTLTSTAAQALNAAFDVTAFSAGIPIGNATLLAVGIRVPRRQH